jgi:hypothetical protein
MFRPLGSGELICLDFCTGFGFLAARTFDDIEDDSAVVLLDVIVASSVVCRLSIGPLDCSPLQQARIAYFGVDRSHSLDLCVSIGLRSKTPETTRFGQTIDAMSGIVYDA